MHWPVIFHVAAVAPSGTLQPAKRRGMVWNRSHESHWPTRERNDAAVRRVSQHSRRPLPFNLVCSHF